MKRHGSKPYPTIPAKQSILGKGGFSTTYRIMSGDRSICAVKVFKLDELGIPFEEVMNEFSVLQSLKHKNIVKCIGYEHDTKQNRFYLKMELVDGGTLADRIKKKSLESSKFKGLMLDIAEGLAYIHGQKVIHRDLKPENILLLEKNGQLQAKIADFGLSAQITSSAASKRNSKGGTTIYFSPERGHGDKYDEKVDMWALGCISIEMVLEQRLADPIWSDRPDVKTKREKLIDDTEQKHSALGKLARKLLCQEANERISALQSVSVLSEVIFL